MPAPEAATPAQPAAAVAVPPVAVPPEVWGPVTWTALHIMTLAYAPAPSPEEQAAGRAFVHSLRTLLPCPVCRTHLAAALEALPPDVSSRDAFVLWGVRLHNAVNERLGKPQRSVQDLVAHVAALAVAPPRCMPLGGTAAAGAGAGTWPTAAAAAAVAGGSLVLAAWWWSRRRAVK